VEVNLQQRVTDKNEEPGLLLGSLEDFRSLNRLYMSYDSVAYYDKFEVGKRHPLEDFGPASIMRGFMTNENHDKTKQTSDLMIIDMPASSLSK